MYYDYYIPQLNQSYFGKNVQDLCLKVTPLDV